MKLMGSVKLVKYSLCLKKAGEYIVPEKITVMSFVVEKYAVRELTPLTYKKLQSSFEKLHLTDFRALHLTKSNPFTSFLS
ncbi:MAG: hypothetical protein K0Q73_8968 [Paenibacillus sp.]|nr:hypothetical protein [Paenibacillus sp.]